MAKFRVFRNNKKQITKVGDMKPTEEEKKERYARYLATILAG